MEKITISSESLEKFKKQVAEAESEKYFDVDVDFIMSKSIRVSAESEEEAIALVDMLIRNNPYDYAYNFSHFVGHEIVDVNEE